MTRRPDVAERFSREAASAASVILAASALERSFPSGDGTIRVLRGVSLSVQRGDVVVITGRSGAGKTTLLNLLVGLDRPDAGEVALEGSQLSGLDEAALARLRREVIGYVPQAPSLLPVLSAAENVEVPLRLRRTPAAERDARVRAALDAVGLGPRSDHRPAELSGGEQQRVAVARAIVGRPALLVADEPTAQLDHDTSASLARVLRRQVAEDGLTVVLASNDPTLIELADRAFELRDGALEPRPGA
jgi:putative ABC transport system ATP-binding protein